MAEVALTFNEHDIHLITQELQGSPNNTPTKNILFDKKDFQSELLEFTPDFMSINISDILSSIKDKFLSKSQILLIILILGNFKPKSDIKIKNTSKYFWLLILKCKIFRVNIFQNKYNSSTLCKLWRKLYKTNSQKIYQLIEEHKNIINKNKTLNISELIDVIQHAILNHTKNFVKLSDAFLTEMENVQIKKKNNFECINGKSNVKNKNDDDTKFLLITNQKKNLKINNNGNNNNSNKAQKQNPNQLNSTNALTLLKDNILALFPCDVHMNVFDDIDMIIKIFQSHFRKIPKEEIINTLNSNSFNIEQAFYDLSNGKKYGFTNSEDYIIKHMKNCDEYRRLILCKGYNNVLRREQYLQKIINNNK